MIMKENLRFTQLRLNYINNNKKISKISNNSCQDRFGFKCTRTIGYRLASIFLKNMKILSQPILVLLFSLLTSKCCLGKASSSFCQINAVILNKHNFMSV